MVVDVVAADETRLSAYRVDPEGTPKGAVVVLQEAFGLTPAIRKLTDGFAAQGYVGIAPALFDRVEKGVELDYDTDALAKGLALVQQLTIDTVVADLTATVESVKSVGKVAVVGYGWGGYLAFQAANLVPGLACAIGYYGGGIADLYRAKRRIPTQLHFGVNDEVIPFEQVRQFRADRPDVCVYDYPAGHGFAREGQPEYDAASAQLALERTLFWISQFLVGPGEVTMKNQGAYANAAGKAKTKKKAAADELGPE